MYFGVQCSLLFFISIIKFMVIASLVSWNKGMKDLILQLSIFNNLNIIIIGFLLSIIAGFINYFLCIYTDLFTFAKERSDLISLFSSICMTLIYMYSIYSNNKMMLYK